MFGFPLLCITRTELRASAPRCADTIVPGAGIASLTCLSINICQTGLKHLDEPALIWKRLENTIVLPLCWRNWSKYRNNVSKRSLKSVKMHSNGILLLEQTHKDGQTQLSCFSFSFLHHEARRKEREKENSEGQGREGGGGWRTGDEWEWWFYWVLSGWVDGE